MARKLSFDTFWNEAQKNAFRYLLWHPEITEIGYGWAAGGWKSYTGVAWQWIMRNKYPGTRWFFWRQELKRLKQTTLATYFKFLEDYKIPKSQQWIYNAQDSVIKFPNGSEILLLDLAYLPSDPLYQRFGSLELTDWFIDESAEVEEQCVTIIMTRIGRQRNDEYWLSPKLLEWFNPNKGHVYRRHYKPYKDWTLPSYRIFIPALATDNKKLPKSYIEQLKKADEVTKQRLLYGNFDYDDTPGRLFEYDAILNLWSNPEIRGEKYISVDVAREWKDKTVIYIWDWFVLKKKIEEAKSNMRELTLFLRELWQEYSVPLKQIIADENGIGGGLVDNLRCQGFINNRPAVQPLKPNLSTYRNFEHLKTQCYHALARFVNEWKITILPDDPKFKEDLIEELDAIVQIEIDKDSKYKLIKKEQIKEKIWRSPDYADAMMMRMFYEVIKRQWIEDTVIEAKEEFDEIDKIIFEIDDENDSEMTPDWDPY